nr:MAG TPA: hypothetical protein [Caudoviricetes sp.]
MAGKQVTELDALPSFTDNSLLPVHNGAGLKKGLLSQLANYLGTKFSNPNLLINPDFKINQRGKSEYAYQNAGTQQYTVDRLRVSFLNVKTTSNGVILSASGTNSTGGYAQQVLKSAVEGETLLTFKVSAVVGTIQFKNLDESSNGGALNVTANGTYQIKGTNTRRIYINVLKGASCNLEWMKLEQGSIATPFIAPNSAKELVKCKQFYNHIYFFHVFYSGTANFDYSFSHVIQGMRTKPTVKLAQSSSSGLSKYSASVNTDSGLTVITTATTSKVGNCNTGGIVELDAEIY